MKRRGLALSAAPEGHRLVRMIVSALMLALLGGPLAAESQGVINRPKQKASFEIRVTAEQATVWQQKGQRDDFCTGEQANTQESGGQVLSARTPRDYVQELRMRDYGPGPPVADLLEPSGKVSKRGLQFEGQVYREYSYSEEIIVPGSAESGCGSCPEGGCGEETTPEPPDCGTKTFGLAAAQLGYAEAFDQNGEELPSNQLLIEPQQLYADELDDYAPYRNCGFWGPEMPGLMPFYDGPFSPKRIFGGKRKLTFEGKVIDLLGEGESFSETELDWKITLTRIGKGR